MKIMSFYSHCIVSDQAKTSPSKSIHFDESLAERTRAKNIAAYSFEEKQWSVIDKIMNPKVRNIAI